MTDLRITQDRINKFFLERKAHFTDGYINNSRYTLEKLAIQLQDVEEISPAIICEKLEEKHDIKKSTLVSKLMQVKVYYNWLISKEAKFTKELLEFIKNIKLPKSEPPIIKQETIDFLLRELPNNYSFLLWMAIKTSARRKSLCDLNLENIEIGKISEFSHYFDEPIDKPIDEDKTIAFITRFDKYGGERAKQEILVPILPRDIRDLQFYLSERKIAESNFKHSFEDEKGRFVFWNRKGKRMNTNSVSIFITKFAKKHGYNFHLHLARHYAIRTWYKQGLRKESIVLYSGHTSKVIDTYFHVEKSTVNSEYLKLGNI